MKLGRAELSSLALAALAAVSALVVFVTRERPTTEERAERAGQLVPILREDDVQRIALRQGDAVVLLQRDGEDWTLQAPAKEPADTGAVQQFLKELGFAKPVRRLDGAKPDELGLTAPRASLLVEMGAVNVRLRLGKQAPSPSGGAYVAVDGEGVPPLIAVVTRDVAELLQSGADTFKPRALVALSPRELSALVVERPNGSLRLTRGKGQDFLLESGARASRDRLSPLLAAVTGLTAARFLDPSAAESARANAPVTKLELRSAQPAAVPIRLELGGACPGHPGELVAIVRSPRLRAACVRDDVAAALGVEASVLADASPFSARPDEVETLTLEVDGKRLVLTRRGAGFLLREPNEAEVDAEAGNQRVAAVTRAPAELVTDESPKQLGLEPPRGRVVLTVIGDDDRATEETLELGAIASDGTLSARRTADGALLAIGREAARAFVVDATLLKSRKILDFALSSLEELAVSHPERQRLRRAPNGFELLEPKGFQHDGELATEAVLALGSLTALRWVADADDGSFGLSAPALVANVRLGSADAGVEEHVLTVGHKTAGGYYAALAGKPGVFLLERSVFERLHVLYIDRSPFMTAPETVERASLTHALGRIELERRGGELVAGARTPVDATALARALEALAALRAEAALHTGAPRPQQGLANPVLTVSVTPLPGLGTTRSFRIGATGDYRGQAVRFARIDGIDATFALAAAKVGPLLDLF